MNDIKLEDVVSAWQEHKLARLPKFAAGRDVNGTDLVMLDADIAGCVQSFLTNRTLDVRRTALLGLWVSKSQSIIPLLNDSCQEYFGRAEWLGRQVLLMLSRTGGPD